MTWVVAMKRVQLIFAMSAFGLAASLQVAAQTAPKQPAAAVDAAIAAAFAKAPAEWQPRLTGDSTMQACSAVNNTPSPAEASAIDAREKATVQYPADGNVIGNWAQGEKIAQSGYGMRFTDYPATQPNGGNCYACHQMTKSEVSFGTIGPSLLEYGKIRKFKPEENKAAYEKIYNSHMTLPCSLMPRFGANKILTIDQIKDITALLMSPDSPVNK